jgi:hypothetical protein
VIDLRALRRVEFNMRVSKVVDAVRDDRTV